MDPLERIIEEGRIPSHVSQLIRCYDIFSHPKAHALLLLTIPLLMMMDNRLTRNTIRPVCYTNIFEILFGYTSRLMLHIPRDIDHIPEAYFLNVISQSHPGTPAHNNVHLFFVVMETY